MPEQPSGEVVLYQRETGEPVIEVRLDADTAWLSQQQIAELFQTARTNIVEHIRHVYEEGELDEAATCRKFRQVRTEGTRQVARELPFYNPEVEETVEFFKIVQNKLHYAAHGRTAAEVIATRADATRPNMGLTAFAGQRPVKAEVGIAKNYLSESELKKLNTLVSAYFDAAEFRAQNHQPTYMRDWIAHLDRIIAAMEAPTLKDAGSVSHKRAVAKAESEYEKYRAQLDAAPSDVEAAYLESVKRTQREIEGRQP